MSQVLKKWYTENKMAKFDLAFEKIKGIEFSNRFNLLHKNPGEKGYTFYGVYQKAHPDLAMWDIIEQSVQRNNTLREASYEMSFHQNMIDRVKQFYKTVFWDKILGDAIPSQKIAEEMFVFYFNTGNKKQTIKMAQLIAGAYPDGIIGPKTLKAFKEVDDKEFDMMYDKLEEKYYRNLVRLHPRLIWALNGLVNRTRKV